ncbi:MAG: chromosome segregation protein SMC, partial [Methyloligellaceae bacterium]
ASDAAQAAREDMEARASEREEAESALAALTGRLAGLRAERQQLTSAVSSEQERITRLETRESEVSERLNELEAAQDGDPVISELCAKVSEFSVRAGEFETRVIAAEKALSAARGKEHKAQEAATDAKLRAQELETEAQTLVKLLKPATDAKWLPIVGKVRVESGYELALGAALGDDLDASDDAQAPAHWDATTANYSDPDLPEGAEPLSKFITAPKALARRLKQIGIVAPERGDALQAGLNPGQRLVSKSGDLWRWDGYSAAADAPTASATRLAERNRLDALTGEAETARKQAEKAEQALASLREEVSRAETDDNEARQAWRAAQGELGGVRDELAAAEHAAQDSSKELGALAESSTRTQESLQEARKALKTAQAALDALEGETALDDELETLRADVAAKRSTYADARAKHDGLEREQQIRQDRTDAVARELEQWGERGESAARQIETLKDRFEETRGEIESFTDLPGRVEARRSRLLDEIGKAEKTRQLAADALAQADTTLRERDKALRQAQSELAEMRENRARIEARLEAARERRAEQARMISEQLECAPEDCLSVAELEPDAALPGLAEIEMKIASLKADRERLGGVNLGAEDALQEIAGELEAMGTEQEDLEEAITRLRQGISKLTREGRKRLLDAFDEVNGHFQSLFKTLFAGGEAELQLIESDDPLESGLEILARPPGKKPQVLTLLSGGEKALAALALIFAVFLTNPSPICVLDEVDAPLDDANVERFCKLIDEMRKATDTRFVIITHHPMTMTRMDRLFGVTMAERGVSQLVSVDLETADQFRDTG